MEEPKKKKAAAKKKPAGAPNNTASCRIVKAAPSRARRLVRDGADGIRRLVFADRLAVLAVWAAVGRDEADFDLTGFSKAAGRIAGTCNP